jgi:hypothetical protein
MKQSPSNTRREVIVRVESTLHATNSQDCMGSAKLRPHDPYATQSSFHDVDQPWAQAQPEMFPSPSAYCKLLHEPGFVLITAKSTALHTF